MIKRIPFFLVFCLFISLAFFLLYRIVRHQSPTIQESKPTPIPSSPSPISTVPIVIYHGPRDKKEVALTFDADMTPFMEKKLKMGIVKSYYNKEVIDILEKEKVPATLFLTGMWVETYPEAARELAQNPLFEIGNHSYSHPAFTFPCYGLTRIGDAQKDSEFAKSQEIINKITGVKPTLFRFPGGCFNDQDLKLAQKHGLTIIQWDVESTDAFNNNTREIIDRVEKQTTAGSIIVFHLNGSVNAPKTSQALPEIIDILHNKGFEFVKVSKMTEN